jgi:hypothetical protein
MQSPWGAQALLYAVAALLVVCISLGVTTEIQSERLDAYKARQESLGEKLAAQNKAVAAWKTEADKQAARVLESAQKAEKVRTVTVERVRTVTVAAIPAACPDAVVWGAEHALEFNRRWEDEK